jgi:type I site-specific restriction endonuclease
MNKRGLSERDICAKFITPALRNAGWDEQLQSRDLGEKPVPVYIPEKSTN